MKLGNYFAKFQHNVEPTEGASACTYCTLREGDSEEVSTGVARVHYKDRYDHEKGRRISLARAMKDLPKEVRTQLWEAYRVSRKSEPRWKAKATA